jgi:pheromone shutdown protein TraB
MGSSRDSLVPGIPGALSAPGFGTGRRPGPRTKEILMDKWNVFSSSRIVRISASASTLIAVAAIVGAGWKWN